MAGWISAVKALDTNFVFAAVIQFVSCIPILRELVLLDRPDDCETVTKSRRVSRRVSPEVADCVTHGKKHNVAEQQEFSYFAFSATIGSIRWW